MKTNQKGFSPTIVLATRLLDGQEANYFSLYFPRPKGQGYCIIWVEQLNRLDVLLEKQSMFSIFKTDPIKTLETKRKKMLEEAMQIQRSGDLKKYAFHIETIDKLEKEIEALHSKKS